MVNPGNNITPDNHFDSLLKFLKPQEETFERLEQLGGTEKPKKKNAYLKKRYASTKSTRRGGCIVCRGKHRDKLGGRGLGGVVFASSSNN